MIISIRKFRASEVVSTFHVENNILTTNWFSLWNFIIKHKKYRIICVFLLGQSTRKLHYINIIWNDMKNVVLNFLDLRFIFSFPETWRIYRESSTISKDTSTLAYERNNHKSFIFYKHFVLIYLLHT